MKTKFRYLTGLAALTLIVPASADTIYSGLLDTTIPTNLTGVTVNIDGGTLNPFFGGVGVANNDLLQPLRDGTGNLDTLLNLSAGTVIDASSTSLSTGYGGSQDHVGSTFTTGDVGYIGFKLNGTDYGWMRVVFTNNTGGAMIKDWAYDDNAGAIATGNILQSGATVTLNSAAGSYTLGSQINGGNNLVKTGVNTTTLTGTNTYSGTTAVNAGTLQVASAATINSSSGVTVAAGAKFAYNSSTSLSVGTTLNGSGTSNRAVLGGTGTIGTSVTLDNLGDTLAPGNSPGIQTYTPAQTWSSFSYDWEVNHFTGTTAGTDFDQINVASTIDLNGGSNSYVLNVLGLTAGNVSGNVQNFSEIDRSWAILNSTGITGFNPANWTINTAGFTDPDTGTWALAQSGNNLMLSYTAIPETDVAALVGGFGMLALLRRRRS
jgi:autotransporter-associated beta strand protein